MKLLTKPLFAYAILVLFFISMVPFFIRTWKIKLNNRFKKYYDFLNKHHNFIGYLALLTAILHGGAWLIILKFQIIFWFGLAGLILSIIAAILGYLYTKNKKKKKYIIWHGILFSIALVLVILHMELGI